MKPGNIDYSWKIFCPLVIFIILLISFYFIPISPPAEISWSRGLWGDEGNLLHNVRNFHLEDKFVTDSCNFFTLSPLYFILNFSASHLIPMKIWCFRLFNSLIGVIFLGIFSYYIMKKNVFYALTLFSLMLSNLFIFFYFKSALAETIMLSMLFISIITYLSDRYKISAFFFVLSFMGKIFAICFLPIFLLYDFYISGYRISRNLVVFIISIIIIMLVIYLPFVYSFKSMIMQKDNLPREITKQVPKSFDSVKVNILTSLHNRIFTKNIFLFGVILILMLFSGKIGKIELFGYFWLLSVSLFLAPQVYRPIRYYLNLLFPMCLIPLSFLFTPEEEKKYLIPFLLKFFLSFVFLASVFQVIKFKHEGYALFTVTSVIVILLFWIFKEGGRFQIKQSTLRVLVIIILIFQLGTNLFFLVKYSRHKRNAYYSLTDKINSFPDKSIILGGNLATQTAFDSNKTILYTRRKDHFIKFCRKFDDRNIYFIKEIDFGDGWFDEEKYEKVYENSVSIHPIGIFRILGSNQ